MLERLKAGKARDYLKVAKKFEADIITAANSLGVQSMNELTKKELNTLVSSLTATNKKYQEAIVTDLRGDLEKLAQDDAVFEQESINKFLKNRVATSAADIAYSKALLAPISASGELLEPFIKNWSQTRINQVNGAIRNGYKEGLTLQQMTQRIRGTKANNFKDGLTNLQKRQAEAVIRTSVQHVSSTARMATLERNKDIVTAYKWRSTLDGRTTQRCRSLDGLEFEMGRGPVPPIHIGCRSTFNYVLDPKLGLDELDEGATRASKTGPVPAKETYYDWLKKQPKSFQEEAIGKQRTAWLNDGKLTAEEFARLNLDKNFRPLTLQEMKAKRSVIISGKTGTTATTAARASRTAQQAATRTAPVTLSDTQTIIRDSDKIMKGVSIDFNRKVIDAAKIAVVNEAKNYNSLKAKYDRARRNYNRPLAEGYKQKLDESWKEYKTLITQRDNEIAKVKALTQKTDDALTAVIFKKRHEEKINKLKITGNVVQKQKIAQAQELFENVLSAKNVNAINEAGTLKVASFSKSKSYFRAHYRDDTKRIYLDKNQDISTILHEMMHSLEFASEEVSKKTKAFLIKRSKGESPKTMNALTGSKSYKPWEKAYEDDWVKNGGSHYMGKVYNDAATEVLTMGVQWLLDNPTQFYSLDREYYNFVIEILNL